MFTSLVLLSGPSGGSLFCLECYLSTIVIAKLIQN